LHLKILQNSFTYPLRSTHT